MEQISECLKFLSFGSKPLIDQLFPNAFKNAIPEEANTLITMKVQEKAFEEFWWTANAFMIANFRLSLTDSKITRRATRRARKKTA